MFSEQARKAKDLIKPSPKNGQKITFPPPPPPLPTSQFRTFTPCASFLIKQSSPAALGDGKCQCQRLICCCWWCRLPKIEIIKVSKWFTLARRMGLLFMGGVELWKLKMIFLIRYPPPIPSVSSLIAAGIDYLMPLKKEEGKYIYNLISYKLYLLFLFFTHQIILLKFAISKFVV